MKKCVIDFRTSKSVALITLAVWIACGPRDLTRAQTSKLSTAAQKPVEPKVLFVTPTAEPRPVLKYRLLPMASELNPGDAAPLYLRIRHEKNSDSLKQIDDKSQEWGELPIEELPVAEARVFVDSWSSVQKQIEFGAHRQYCDWSFSLPEQRLEAFEILLPDTQEMRRWARLLSLKAKVEIAEHKYDDAINTIKTGMAFGRHVGDGPFLISALVGVAIESVMLTRVEELIEQPGAPNLYWALTALPTPLVSTRAAFENEQRLCESMIPELEEVDRDHTDAEWTVILTKIHERMRNLGAKLVAFNEASPELQSRLKEDFSGFRKGVLDTARPWLVAQGLPEHHVKAMSDDEAVMRAFVGQYRELRDSVYRGGYLPFPAASQLLERGEKECEAAKKGPLAVFATIFAATRAALAAETRLQRRVEILRVVEGLRLHAAENGGRLPRTLEEITIVPIPLDPATGRPFEYSVKDGLADILAPLLPDQPITALAFRIHLAK